VCLLAMEHEMLEIPLVGDLDGPLLLLHECVVQLAGVDRRLYLLRVECASLEDV
jgi:hypothetical protein